MSYKIAQLILTPGSRSNTTSEIFVAQPSADKEALVGKLFILAEIESKKANDLKIINFLVENLSNNYYQNEKMVLRERIKTVKIEHILESALAKTNKGLLDFIKNEKIKLNPDLISATVGAVYENELHFSSIGKNKVFLIYRGKNEAGKKYNIADIIKQAEKNEKKSALNPTKLFSSVISGPLPRGGYFFFANEALAEYLSGKQIIEVITALPPTGAVEQIKNSLSKINHYVSFLGLIIKSSIGYGEEGANEPVAVASSGESISKLNKVEERTEKLLSPGGIVSSKKFLGIFKAAGSKMSGQIQSAPLKDKILFKKTSRLAIIKKIWNGLKNLILYLFRLLALIYKTLTDKEKLKEAIVKIKKIPAVARGLFFRMWQWMRGLSLINKILFLIVAISFFALAQNIFFANYKNNKANEEKIYSDLIVPIEQKINQAEASLLYNNEGRAIEVLGEVKNLMAQLPRKTEEQSAKYAELDKKYNEQMEKVRHVVKIENPKETANFSRLNENATPENIVFSPVANKIYSGDAEHKTIYIVDLANNSATAKNNLGEEIKTLKKPMAGKDENLYYLNGNKVAQFNSKTEEVKILAINSAGHLSDISAAADYNNRLYLLNSKDGQVYRYNKRPDGFADEAPSLKKEEDFSEAVDMAIDGSIYVLKKNSEVLKFFKGSKEEEFKISAIDPGLENASKIFVSPEKNYIYILEPAKQRLVVFDKTGKFILQYKSDQFTDLKDFTVDENKKIIYFLNGKSVYEIEVKELK
jgi:hypothetical protein